jgi:hypothetical protein
MASLVCWNQHDQSATACMAHHDRIGAMLAATRKALGSDAPMLFVCMLQGSWGPALDLSKVLMAVRQLLAEPNPKDPLVVDIVRDSNCMACRWMQALLCPYRLTQHQQPTYADATNLQPAYPMIAWSNKSPVALMLMLLQMCSPVMCTPVCLQAEECASQPELFRMKAKQHVAKHARPAAATTQSRHDSTCEPEKNQNEQQRVPQAQQATAAATATATPPAEAVVHGAAPHSKAVSTQTTEDQRSS